jgi:PAS domain S-box-containing protein
MSQHLSQNALNALMANIAILDNNGVIIAVNTSWRTFADANGLAWKDYGVGRSYLAIAEAASGTFNEGAQEAARGIQELLSGQRETFSQQYPCHSSSEKRWFMMRAAQFQSKEGMQVVVSHENITEWVQAERTMQESNFRLNNILESAMDAIITVNEGQILTMLNPAAERMFGFEGKDIVGRPLDELLPERFRKKHTDHIRSFGQTKVTARSMGKLGTLLGRRASGEEFPIEVSISQINVSGQKLYTAIIRDITERKLLEGQIQELATLEERNRISRELHDSVTQSLYSINLQSDATIMALSSGRIEDAEKRLQTLKDIAQDSMAEMRLLIFELHPSILEEAGLVTALRLRLETVESRSGIQAGLDVKGERRLPIAVEKELYQISLEGLNNVLKHAKAKKVLVRISFEHDRCRLMIQDDGVSFDLERNDRFGGYGLENIRDRLEKIGGELTIISEPGKGSTLDIEVAI